MVSSNLASAHTELLKSSSAANKIISVMPKSIKLTFGEELLVVTGSKSKANSITVKSPSNKIVSTGDVQVTKNLAIINLLKLKELVPSFFAKLNFFLLEFINEIFFWCEYRPAKNTTSSDIAIFSCFYL